MKEAIETLVTAKRRDLWKLGCAICIAMLAATVIAGPALGHERPPRRKAVTVWWVLFNDPDGCVANPAGVERCGAVDIFGQPYLDSVAAGAPDPSLIAPNLDSELAVIYATGGVTDRRGYIRLTASIYRSELALALGGDNIVDPLGLGRGFSDSGAEVHLVIRTHGLVVAHGLITQITSFLEPFCSDPLLLFVSGHNTCADVQAAVFAPGETGKDAVFDLANGQILSNASAYLVRQGDVLQAVIETRLRDRSELGEDD